MDYKYIEQLLERYWRCDTSVEEEQILRAFFSQKEGPSQFRQYRELFSYETAESKSEPLGADFDNKMLSLVGKEAGGTDEPVHVKAITVSLRERMMPLLKAVAFVAVIIVLGNAAQFSFSNGGKEEDGDDINYAEYTDTYSDPSVAYGEVEDALQLISEGIGAAMINDTLASVKLIGGGDSIKKE